MDTLRIYRTTNTVTLHDAEDRMCFSIESSLAENLYYLSVRSVTQHRSGVGPYPDFWHDEIAKIVWNSTTPFILYKNAKFDIDTFMQSEGLFDKCVLLNAYVESLT